MRSRYSKHVGDGLDDGGIALDGDAIDARRKGSEFAVPPFSVGSAKVHDLSRRRLIDMFDDGVERDALIARTNGEANRLVRREDIVNVE